MNRIITLIATDNIGRQESLRLRLSRFQYYKLRDFFNLIYHKFYNYTLTMED